MPLLREIRGDWERHGRQWRNRGVWALAVYRFGRASARVRMGSARWLMGKLYGLLSICSEITTGVTMSRTVEIGDGFLIIHASTIFIHPRVVIGDHCGIMHNVTIGTNMADDVPVIGNNVFIGCGASVLGRVKVGDNVRIAANSLVIRDVPADSFAVGVPAKNYRRLAGAPPRANVP
jgi:serine O-acetyltransferase